MDIINSTTQILFLIVLNALLYGLTFLFYQLKRKRFSCGSLLLATYACSSIFSIVFYLTVPYNDIRFAHITVFPFIYMFTLIIISFSPILALKSDTITNIYTGSIRNEKLINSFLILIALLSILPFVESVIHVLANGTNTKTVADTYYARADGISNNEYLSWFGRKCYALVNFVIDIHPVLFMYYLGKKDINKKLVIGLILPIITVILYNYSHGGRSTVTQFMLYLLFVYSLFSNTLKPKIRKIVKLTGTIIFVGFFSLMLLITVLRFNSYSNQNEAPFIVGVSLYLGEGFLNFNETAWYAEAKSNGDTCFPLIKKSLGMKTFTKIIDRRNYWAPKLKIPTHIFYTYIGSFYVDFGRSGTFFFILLIAYFLRLITKKVSTYTALHTMIIISLFGKIFMVGIFFFPYGLYKHQFLLLTGLIFALILKLFSVPGIHDKLNERSK